VVVDGSRTLLRETGISACARSLIPPDAERPIVIGAGSISDRGGPARFVSDARRSGLIWPWPPRKRRRPGSTAQPGD
jgi:hypothetical protein